MFLIASFISFYSIISILIIKKKQWIKSSKHFNQLIISIYFMVCIFLLTLIRKIVYIIMGNIQAIPFVLITELYCLIVIFILIEVLLSVFTKKNTLIFTIFSVILNTIVIFFDIYLFSFGIINMVYYVIYSGSIFGFYLLEKYLNIYENITEYKQLKKESKKRFISFWNKQLDIFIVIIVDAFLGLSATIGVMMTILYNEFDGFGNISIVSAVVVVIVGYIFIAIGILIWFIIPYIQSKNFIKKQILYEYDIT